jgi:hydroxymethylpyrimidine/phosphomethylpyrimidine kinase
MKSTLLKSVPCALTIAGSDSGGGAGIQADLKTFYAFGVHGLSAITCITSQNPKTISSVTRIPARTVRSQLEAVESFFEPRNIKIGMLCSSGIIREVAQYLSRKKDKFVVLDPLIVSTSGRRLLNEAGITTMLNELVPHCSLITPNLPEARFLLGESILTSDSMRVAAKTLFDRYGCPVLLKGGHLQNGDNLIDFFWDGKVELPFKSKRILGITTHGTGCTYASGICAGMASGLTLERSLTKAHRYVLGAIRKTVKCANGHILNW